MNNRMIHIMLMCCLAFSAIAQPVINLIEPRSAIPGKEVSIFGANFDLTATNNTVTFNGTSAVVTQVVGINSLKVTVPVENPGPQDVIITNGSGTSQSFIFTILTSPVSSSFGTQKVVSILASGAQSVYAEDMDGDGDLDILSASGNDDKIAWYKNNGMGGFGSEQVVSSAAVFAVSVYATDLDGDGDQDILSGSALDNTVSWFENTDGLGTFGTQQVISNTVMGVYSVHSADIDSDGDMDVLSASPDDSEIYWHENTDGLGSFSAKQVISTALNFPYSVHAADIDGDGDMDVLSASYNDNKVAWYENTDGAGLFGVQQIITTSAMGAWFVYAADIDGDGDMDVISASGFDDKVAWYKNTDGFGTSWAPKVITTQADNAISVFATDIDSDGDMG